MAFKLPDLPYAHNALEPHIDAKTMEIHHGKHHNGYTTKLNAALEGHPFADKPIEEVLRNINDVPEEKRQAVINNGGGYANHKLFWSIMSPNGGGEPAGELADAINSTFGSFEKFKDTFASTAAGQFGSGWGWLCVTKDGDLKVLSTPNQDSPYMNGLTPILGVDVWEHAYYLHYQNRRPDYIEAFFSVIDWEKVNELYKKAK
ncbi:MAG: superoxide dismutase [Balneolaceae bacterium]